MSNERPTLECDLIMKGGITSGIVYPKAIHELSKHYRLRSIGGASAGAIAAAVAAAAEFGRRGNSAKDPFAEVGELPHELGAPVAGGMTRMLSLFKPDPKTHNAFHWLLNCLDAKRGGTDVGSYVWRALHLTGNALPRFPVGAAVGLLLVGAIVYGARGIFFNGSAVDWVAGLVTGVAALLTWVTVTLAGALVQSMLAIRSNGYGLVSGMHADGEALTSWLHQKIQTLAGRPFDQPLTFGDLWGNHNCAPHKRDIDLRMMTSCLSLGQGLCFPLEPKEKFYYDEAELARFFPAELMKWMREHPRSTGNDKAFHEYLAKSKRFPLPDMAHLPILLAVRMSLSFPILLSAIPLWSRRHEDGSSYQLQRCWFSDGGLISNFPIHFFDALIPKRPTFGITLVDADAMGLPAHTKYPEDFIHLPRDFGIEQRIAINFEADGKPKLMRFVSSLFGTLHGWSDRAQQRAPGFKERVVSIALREGEGGINLRMTEAQIDSLAARGLAAAKRLVLHYHPSHDPLHAAAAKVVARDPGILTTWPNHRWVRYRTTGLLLEEALESLLEGDEGVALNGDDLRDAHKAPGEYPFLDASRRKAALDTYLELIDLAATMRDRRKSVASKPQGAPSKGNDRVPGDDGIYGVNYPIPRSRLRIMPRD